MEVDTTKCNKRVLDQAHTVASWIVAPTGAGPWSGPGATAIVEAGSEGRG